MIVTGKIVDSSIDFVSGKPKLTLSINEKQAFLQGFDDLNSKEKLSIEIKPYRPKRSLDANALCWKLCTEIANELRSDKDSVYVDMLRRYGQSDIMSVVSGVDVSGYFKYYDEFGTGYVNGKKFIHYKVYKGSSEYDTREMSILLDGIVSEAKDMGIDVMSKRELTLIKGEWNK